MVMLNGWSPLRIAQFGELFLAELRAAEMNTLDAEIEKVRVEISKTDRATCAGW